MIGNYVQNCWTYIWNFFSVEGKYLCEMIQKFSETYFSKLLQYFKQVFCVILLSVRNILCACRRSALSFGIVLVDDCDTSRKQENCWLKLWFGKLERWLPPPLSSTGMTALFFMNRSASVLTLVLVKSCRVCFSTLLWDWSSDCTETTWKSTMDSRDCYAWGFPSCACCCIPLQPPHTCVIHSKTLLSDESYYIFLSRMPIQLEMIRGECTWGWSAVHWRRLVKWLIYGASFHGLGIEGVSRSVIYWHWNVLV